mgnify:CR=1 FL=1
MKVLLTIEGGFAKTIFEGDKDGVEWFLKGFQYSRKTNLESPEVIGVLTEGMTVEGRGKDMFWCVGVLSAMENKKGILEVVE